MVPWLLCLPSLSKSLWRIFVCDYSPELQALGRQTSFLVRHSSSSPSPVLSQKLYHSGRKRKRDWELLTWSPKGQPAKAFCYKSGVCCICCCIHWIHCIELWINFLCLTTSRTRDRNIISVTLCLPMSLTQPDVGPSLLVNLQEKRHIFRIGPFDENGAIWMAKSCADVLPQSWWFPFRHWYKICLKHRANEV